MKIYFDMDGVLADFDRGLRELCGRAPRDQEIEDEAEDERMWDAVRRVEHFYDRLEPNQEALALFQKLHSVLGDDCRILTGIPTPRRHILYAAEDKRRWVSRYLGEDVLVHVVLRREKANFCTGKDCILIDDYSENIREWESNGGTGIWYQNAEQTEAALKAAGAMAET